MADDKTAQLAINTIRTLSMDAVQAAKSGHPGTNRAHSGEMEDGLLLVRRTVADEKTRPLFPGLGPYPLLQTGEGPIKVVSRAD
jgi:transketolase-like protein